MSDGDAEAPRAARPRLPLIALGCAVLAVAVSIIAAIVALKRDDKSPVAAAPAAALIDQRVAASDVLKLRDHIEVVVEAGLPRGVRVTDPALAAALGLREDDMITAVSGRSITREADIVDVTFRAGSRATTLYVEVDRSSTRTLMRWLLDGNLLDASRDHLAAARAKAAAAAPSLGGGGIGTSPGSGSGADPGALDPYVDSIVQIDATHSRVSRATLDNLLANATVLSRGCRVVPAVKSGKPDGYKLFAIRPSSVFARLGFDNGDTVHSINGAALADVDDLVSLLVDAKKKVTSFQFDLTRRGQPVEIHVEITR